MLVTFLAALATSFNYSLSDALGPGPGFFPFWLSFIGALLTIAILSQVRRGKSLDVGEAVLPRGEAAWQAASVIIALAIGAALLEPIGYRLTMLAFIVAVLLGLGARSPVAILLTALAGSFGVFHVFYHWLKVPLPVGMFGV